MFNDESGGQSVTMKRAAVLERMQQVGLVPVLRASSAGEALAIAKAVAEGGVTVLEVTMTVPGALDVMRTLVHDSPEILVGAGTVLDAETARICILEGAQFVVSPGTDTRVIELCRRYSIAVLPGALTPTEIVTAWQAGADVVKVFPVSAMGGARYLASLKGPLPQVDLIPTGGVSLATARDFLEAGAFALGVGGDLAGARAAGGGAAGGAAEAIRETARAYRRIVAEFRAGSAGSLPGA